MNNIKNWFNVIFKIDIIYKLNLSNSFEIPELDKINVNSCIRSAIDNPINIVYSIILLKLITNQKPIVCKAKKSIAAFKLRKGTIVSCNVSLRKKSKFDFLSIFIFLALAKVKKYNFCNINSEGNVSIGIKDLFIFPQIMNSYEKFPRNMSAVVNIKTSRGSKLVANLLFSALQIPIKNEKKVN